MFCTPCVLQGVLWACDANSPSVNVCSAVDPPTFPVAATVFAPPVEAKAALFDLPKLTLSFKSGTLKVVDPFPDPYVVETIATKAE